MNTRRRAMSRRALCAHFSAFALLAMPALTGAQSLSLTLLDPVRPATPGGFTLFRGTVANNTGAALNATDLSLNFFGFDPTVLTITPLLGDPDFALRDGGTSEIVDLFRVDLAASAVIGQNYDLTLFLSDSSGNLSSDVSASVSAATPAPPAALLFGSGLTVGLAAFRRNRALKPTR